MNIDLISKKALVGASSQGIGFAIAKELAQCGADVTIVARNEQKLIEKIKELPVIHQEQSHQYLVVDYADYNAFETIITAFFNHNSIDILVNNTNGPKPGKALDVEVSDYQQAFDQVFKSVCKQTSLALPYMIKQQSGRIINVSSISVKAPVENLVLSNSVRSATLAWAKTLANEIGQYNITINNVLTGYFLTERLEGLIRQEAAERQVDYKTVKREKENEVPLKRIGDPKEYGSLVAFLASEYASYITGTNIPIDGGLTKSY